MVISDVARFAALIVATALLPGEIAGQQPNPPGQVKTGEPKYEAYLFAHMVHSDYGRLYYSVSLDGLHWTALNGGKRVFEGYRGHPDIAVGPDGRFYIAGNRNDGAPDINFWVTSDLISWEKYSDFTPNLKATPGYGHALQRIGAPKLYFDQSSATWLLTWHTPHLPGTKEDAERYWASQRTLYVTSRDLKNFDQSPRRLFPWEMGTIDVVVRRVNGRYYAILKDERYPELDWPTGKTIRIASGASMTGPWSDPGPPISPNFHEAPMLIPSPDGTVWYLYYEEYPGMSYGVSVSQSLEGPWYKLSGYTRNLAWNKYALPPDVRHGCMLPISRDRYDALVKAFGIAGSEAGQ